MLELFEIPQYTSQSEAEIFNKICEEMQEVANELTREPRNEKLLLGEVADLLQVCHTLAKKLKFDDEEITDSLRVKFSDRKLI